MNFLDALKKIKSTQDIPTDWVIRFHYENETVACGFTTVTLRIDKLFEDWYDKCVFCPDNGEFIYGLAVSRDSTGETYFVEANSDFTFETMMNQIENMFYKERHLTVVRHPADNHIMSPKELADWANTVHNIAGGKGNPYTPSDIVRQLCGFHCDCGTEDGTPSGLSLGDFTLVSLFDESVREGGKAYMQCSVCGSWSHI